MKIERENLILYNTKLDSEIKRMKYDLEDMKNVIEKQMIIIKNKEEIVTKQSEDINYLSFNLKKIKQDEEKAVNNAIAFQQIVRKMEKNLAECEIKKEKAEQDLKNLKQQLQMK